MTSANTDTQIQEELKITQMLKHGQFSYSFEVTPDIAEEEINNLELNPAFFSVTWHAKTHQCKDLDIAPLKIASFLRSRNKQVLLHLSCEKMRKDYLCGLLTLLQQKGVCNLFVILGESYDSNASDFKSTLELIKFIREKTGQYFCIGIAGFVDCNEEKLLQMKEKIDNGADFIITQAFFDVNSYKIFLDKCSKIGIGVPIIPGVFPFETYEQLTNFIRMCRVKVSNDLLEHVRKEEGTPSEKIIKNLVQAISTECHSAHFHFFTLNKLQNTCMLIKQLH